MSRKSRLTLPWACMCSVNQRLGPAGSRLRLTKRYRQALEDATLVVMAGWGGETLTGPVEVTVTLYWPDAMHRDLDDWCKLPLDALQGVAIEDDGQIVRLTLVDGGLDREEPRAEIVVSAAGGGGGVKVDRRDGSR